MPRIGYEQVFTVTDYFDGPRQGVANFRGLPHFYDCIFDEVQDQYSSLYRLTPISREIFDLAIEAWAIWLRWDSAFHTGQTTIDSHPALPQDRARHKEIKAVLDLALKTDNKNCIVQAGDFEPMGTASLGKSVTVGPWQIRWTEPTTEGAG